MGCGIAGCSNTSRSTPRSRGSERTTQTQSPNPTDTPAATETLRETETVSETSEETATTKPPEAVESAVVYIPFAGDKFGKCTEVCHPKVGQYSDPIPPEVSSQHVEWLENAGISTVMFNFGESKIDYKRLSNFLHSDLQSLSVEPFYVISQAIRRKRDLEADFAFLRKNLLSTSTAKTIDGKPVVTFWDFDFLAWGGSEASQRAVELVEEYGGPKGFVDYLREQLTVNGTEPLLIGDLFDHAIGGYPENYAELNKQLDGATNWINAFGESGQVSWEYARNHVAQNFAATRAFCDQHEMRYYPMVYPGFDDRHNSCWGSGRSIPRGPDHLRDLFELARKYTTGRVNVATFNDWTEGHQIEPGQFRDTDYGMEYLDVVREFSVTR